MNLAVNLEDGNILLYSYDFNNILVSFRQCVGCGVWQGEGWEDQLLLSSSPSLRGRFVSVDFYLYENPDSSSSLRVRPSPNLPAREWCCGEAGPFAVEARTGVQGRFLSVRWASRCEMPEQLSSLLIWGRIEGVSRLSRAASLTGRCACHSRVLHMPPDRTRTPGARSHFVCAITVRAARKSRALLIRARHFLHSHSVPFVA